MIQSRRQFLKQAAVASSVSLLGSSPSTLATITQQSGVVRVRPREYAAAFANPLKGFRPDIPSIGGAGLGLDNPLVTLARHYIKWNEIENSATDGVDKIMEFCNPRWTGIEERNIKIIPRVFLYWPVNYYWPGDLRAGDYGSRMFLHRLQKLIAKLGEAWNRDPRIAYVETGIVGPCGEQWNPTPHWELRKVIGDSYAAAFPDKLCMIRYPWQWPDYEFGVFWDSWGTHKDTARMLEVLESPELAHSWKTRVRGGEISYGFGEPPGDSPDDTMAKTHHIDWVECLVRRGHWNHLGWVAEYDWKKAASIPSAQRLQRALGYRFVIEEVNYSARASPGESLEINFTVRNIGSSPFYYDWPVELSLLDERTRQPVWRETFAQVDIRQWLPGDAWGQFADWDPSLTRFVLDHGAAHYREPASAHTAHGRFTLPKEIRPGTYVLALAILDPAGLTPACRFATANYFNKGRHPIGRIQVGNGSTTPELDPAGFDDIATDNSVGYQMG